MRIRFNDRKTFVLILFSFIFMLLAFRLGQITLVQGESYSKEALNLRLKKHTEIARRGEIYDRNNVVLAKNGTTLYLDYLYSRTDKKEFEETVIKLFKLLKENGEKPIGLPIVIENDSFEYRYDIRKKLWLEKMGFSENESARRVFDTICYREGVAPELDDYSKEKILILKGIYLPIVIKDMVFSFDRDKKNFLDSYKLEPDSSASRAYRKLREYFGVSEELTDVDAYYVLTMRDVIKKLGYIKYEPIEVCSTLKKETAVRIEEQSIYFPNFSIGVKPFRDYPKKNVASHIIGYMGHISTDAEREKYSEKNGYTKDDLVGKVGIEASFEDELHGKVGITWMDVDNRGKKIRDINNSIPDERFYDIEGQAGNNITLTIDSELQENLRGYIVKLLNGLRSGSEYKSKFGTINFNKSYQFARTGAAMVVDVKTGEVYAMASYPDFDLNLFTGGIDFDDWQKLQPENKYDPLGPKPLYNIATMTAVQPGSTFKMVTAFAALSEGIDPYKKIYTKGVIEAENGVPFGCWIWNLYEKTHGFVDMIKAIEVSCNYYFYVIGSGFDYSTNQSLNINMNSRKIIEAAKMFGFDEKSGLEIGEYITGVPDPEKMKKYNLFALKSVLESVSDKYFSKEILSDKKVMDQKISEILELSIENPKISRNELYSVLKTTFNMTDRKLINEFTDLIKYSYFNRMRNLSSDAFNLAIGQGANAYTPAQMAKYVSAIANGGYVQNLTLIKTVDSVPQLRDPFKFIDPQNNMKYIREGMRAAAVSLETKLGLKDFSYGLALKTGTAEKEGKLSLGNEEAYLKKYLSYITDSSLAEVEAEAMNILNERSLSISKIYDEIESTKDEEKLKKLKARLNRININIYLDKGNAMREAIKSLSGNKIKDEKIDRYKREYDNFTWFVSYAPYNDPKVAVVVFIPQGGSGSYGLGVSMDIIDDYMKKYGDR